ncbi:MAG: NADH-quinone oxidoreductase subunit M [Solirubrobacterales bacterium]
MKDSAYLVILMAMPLLGVALASLFPERHVGPVAAITTMVQISSVAVMLLKFESQAGFQESIDQVWVGELGIHFALGLDGLNVFLVALTVLAWTIATWAASLREVPRPRIFYIMLALAEVGTLGAFLAQDLILFVLFFDLLLIPFYFLIGMWGNGDRRAATTKFVIYTLAGSLLMLASAVALGVISAQENQSELSFLYSDMIANPISSTAQTWIFLGFAFALLIKMPLPPLHGWMPDTYRAAPLPVLIPLAAVVAKLGAFGFLRVVLPQLPIASFNLHELMIVLGLAGIVYGSVMALMQDNVRLVIGYSSIAQIGFVTLGIFVLDAKGVEGAVLQMANHGLVVIPLFLIVGFLAERAGGEKLSEMGGLAKNAPLFAALFLIVSLATLAMPGSANFVGELYILFGAFESEFVYGAVATAGVILAAAYMIRLFQNAMHKRASEGADGASREIDANELGLLLPTVLILLALAVYPQFMVERIAPAADEALATLELPGAADLGESPDVSAEDEPPPINVRPPREGDR